MADLPITSGSTSLGASGLNSLLTFLADQIVAAGRARANPLRYCMDVSSAVAEKGNIVRVMVSPTITSSLLTDGNARVLDDSTGTSVDVTLNKNRTAPFARTQIADALEGGASALMRLQAGIAGMFNDIEADVLSSITSGITTNTTGTYNSALTEAVFVAGVSKVLGYNCPPGLLTCLVRHDANAWGALSQLANFNSGAVRADGVSPLARSDYGSDVIWHGCRVSICQSLPKNTNNIDNIIMSPSAIAVAMRPLQAPRSPGVQAVNVVDAESGIAFQILYQWNGSTLADEVIIRCLYGYSVVKQTWANLLKS